MKVLKFGGTSVGSATGIRNLKHIVERQSRPTVIIVSALGGITDLLITTAKTAAAGIENYKDMLTSIVNRHHDMIDDVITNDAEGLKLEIDSLLSELSSIYQGVF
ncbi:MAG: bifunctional aspartate kinase/homoserine dehydrogenase I, partial [Duncaniella sp.]|nr:bifunctional aspartate kinase/homoserine dehydrogenase I [Duncaniella sp.]